MKIKESYTRKATTRIPPATRYSPAVCAAGRSCPRAQAAADDNPMKLMSIAMKPLCEPPFPIERIEGLTALKGGEGTVK